MRLLLHRFLQLVVCIWIVCGHGYAFGGPSLDSTKTDVISDKLASLHQDSNWAHFHKIDSANQGSGTGDLLHLGEQYLAGLPTLAYDHGPEVVLRLSEAYRDLDRPQQAKSLLRRCLASQPDTAYLAEINHQLAAILYHVHQYDSAIALAQHEIRRMYEAGYPDSAGLARLYNVLGASYLKKPNPNPHLAFVWLTRSLHLAELKDSANVPITLLNLAMADQALGRPQDALIASARAETLAERSQNDAVLIWAYESLVSQYKALGNYKLALDYLEKGNTLQWDQNRLQTERSQQELAANYRAELSAKENQRLAAQNSSITARVRIIYSMLGAASVLISILLIWAFARQRQRRTILRQHTDLQAQNAYILGQSEELERLNETKDLLISVISHDVRGPVGNLGQVLSMARQDMLSEQERSELLTALQRDVDRTHVLLNDVLIWAKSQMLDFAPRPMAQPVDGLLLEVRTQLLTLAHARSLAIHIRMPDIPPILHTDPGMLRVILRNLMANALRYSPAGTSIEITAETAEAHTLITVRDYGPGMAPDLVAGLSDLHQATRRLRNREDAGSGLGLVLVADFCNKLGIGLQFTQPSEGPGTLVCLSLPARALKAREQLA